MQRPLALLDIPTHGRTAKGGEVGMKTRREAIENLEYLISGECCDSHMDYVDEIEMAITDMKICDANNAGWISVKDRLPENELTVIGYTPVDGYMFIGFHKTEVAFGYDWSSWYIITSMRSTKKITKKVTHWMPLPEPPKEG
jgi:hypothetical protein